LFLYEGNEINFELSFKEQVDLNKKNKNEMNISIDKRE
jgi:hypothetical protein